MVHQTILVVEDEMVIRMLMTDVLRDEGYLVIEAASGDEGRDVLLSGQSVDLVVTDVRTPGKIDGIELTAISRQLQPERPVIVVSGHLPPDAADTADVFLQKPYLLSTFLDIVIKLIGRATNGPSPDPA